MADVVFNRFKASLANGTITWNTTNGIRILLLGTAVSAPNADLDFVSDLVDGSNNIELSTTNYTRKDLANRTVVLDDTNDRAGLDADDVTWTALGVISGGPTVRAAVIYLRVGGDDSSPSDDPLCAFIDLVDQQVNSGDYIIRWNAAGIFTVS